MMDKNNVFGSLSSPKRNPAIDDAQGIEVVKYCTVRQFSFLKSIQFGCLLILKPELIYIIVQITCKSKVEHTKQASARAISTSRLCYSRW